MPKLAILLTTFLRNKLAWETIMTIMPQLSNDCILLIADQNRPEEKLNKLGRNWLYVYYYNLPFDCGLSYARNYLIYQTYGMGIPYVFMGADSIQFTQIYDFQPVIDFLEQDPKRGLVGFLDEGRKCKWEYNTKITPAGIKFTEPTNSIEFEGIKYLKCDICNNLFLARTNTLLNIYDEKLKLAEHEDMFLNYKNRDYEVYWTDKYVFKKITDHSNEEYNNYRKRFSEYRELFKQKYNMSGWVIYPPKKR